MSRCFERRPRLARSGAWAWALGQPPAARSGSASAVTGRAGVLAARLTGRRAGRQPVPIRLHPRQAESLDPASPPLAPATSASGAAAEQEVGLPWARLGRRQPVHVECLGLARVRGPLARLWLPELRQGGGEPLEAVERAVRRHADPVAVGARRRAGPVVCACQAREASPPIDREPASLDHSAGVPRRGPTTTAPRAAPGAPAAAG